VFEENMKAVDLPHVITLAVSATRCEPYEDEISTDLFWECRKKVWDCLSEIALRCGVPFPDTEQLNW
jgi:hypothetical protein